MEPIVENTSEITREILYEALKKGMNRKYKIILNLWIVLTIIIVFVLILLSDKLDTEEIVNLITRFYQDQLELSYNNGNRRFVHYNDLRNYYITENLYILAMRGNKVIMMKKDSFTKGTMEEAHKLIWKNKRY
jgi:hypothetical protein